ncbi:MAG: transglycosylase domain-containing protein [Myxococcota bacterium]|nr:transglycosylase domain-containing protein [Myxococcota bacterium]
MSAAELAPEQYAFLAGLVQSPSRYDPDCRPEAALRRRNYVLKELHRAVLLTDQSQGIALNTPLGVIPRPCLKRPAPPPAE